MLLLTDCPRDTVPEVFGSLEPGLPEELPPGERVLWEALGGARRFWRARAPKGFESPWRRLLMVRAAPRSQLAALYELLARDEKLPTPIAACALSGDGFVGLRGRPWCAVEGNLHLVAGMRPKRPAVEFGAALVALPAVATAEAVSEATGGRVELSIKWVNDLCVGPRKMGGVLLRTALTAGSVDSAVVGVGLNVAAAPAIPSTPCTPVTGCLRELLEEGLPSTGALTMALLAAIARRHDELVENGPEALLSSYRARSLVLGRHVRIWPEEETFALRSGQLDPEPLVSGKVIEIGDDLSLRLEGRSEPVVRGRLAICQA